MRQLVELLETTPLEKRHKMLEVGRAEDPEYTERAISYMLSFDDITRLPDMELAEVIGAAPPRMTALAVSMYSEEIKERFLKNALPKIAVALRDHLTEKVELKEIGGAKLKLIQVARSLERQGHIRTKKIPMREG